MSSTRKIWRIVCPPSVMSHPQIVIKDSNQTVTQSQEKKWARRQFWGTKREEKKPQNKHQESRVKLWPDGVDLLEFPVSRRLIKFHSHFVSTRNPKTQNFSQFIVVTIGWNILDMFQDKDIEGPLEMAEKDPKWFFSNQHGRLGVFFGMASSAFLVGLLIIEMPTKFHVNFMHFFLLIKKWLLFFAHKIFATRPKLDMPTKCHAAKSKQLCSWLHL